MSQQGIMQKENNKNIQRAKCVKSIYGANL